METNSTFNGHFNSTGQQQQQQQQAASGRSLFWGLAAIAMNAMLQPSFTGKVMSREVFEDSLAPHRSSPFVCLTDAAADVWLIARRFRRTSNGMQDDRPRAVPIAVSMRLATFLFSVLPQVIKILSARGIPVTQAVTTGLFLSTIVSMSRTLHLVDGQQDLEEAQKDFTDLLREASSSDPTENARITDAKVKGVLVLAAVFPHAIGLYYVWTAIASGTTSIELTSANVVNGT
ncbi:hypothetical protein N0V82_008468 [Gnomoniopsis sp. IMI 355080]|nr:hypothetical protein N0V82_008468 [Gnomoniopsis sp. IMI 355080]